MTFLHRLFLSLDIFLDNFCPTVSFGMTISAHAQMAKQDGRLWGKVVIAFCDLFQKNHGPLALQAVIDRANSNVKEVIPYIEKLNGKA